MAIYNKDGVVLSACYDMNGTPLSKAYDINGNEVWTSGSTTLRVMSYNIQWLHDLNGVPRIFEEIFDEELPDIVGLQEVSKASTFSWPSLSGTAYNTLLSDSYGLTYSANGTAATNKTAIVSKYAISDFQTVRFSDVDGYGEYREYTKCHITVGGKTILWYNTHLGLGPTYRTTMIEELLADVAEAMETEDYIILTGDTNVQVGTSYPIESEASEQVDLFIDSGLTLANWADELIPTFTNSTGSGEWTCLDNIMVSPNITISSAWANQAKVDDNQESYTIDHLPLMAVLTLD